MFEVPCFEHDERNTMGISAEEYAALGYVEYDELAVPDTHAADADRAAAFFANVDEELLIA